MSNLKKEDRTANWMYCMNEGTVSHFEFRPANDFHQEDYKCSVCGFITIK